MNFNERHSLREKHHSVETWTNRYHCHRCLDPYPCDVIKVLNAWETEQKEK